MELVVKLVAVLGLGAFELWAAVPAGLALQLHPVATGVTAAAGAILGALAIVLPGERVRAWLLSRHGGQGRQGRAGRIQRVWQRYGVVGLGLLAPILTGVPLGVALGLALGAPSGRLLFWSSLGAVLWSAGLTLVGALGLAGVQAMRG